MSRTQFSVSTCNLYNLNEPGLRIHRDPVGWDQQIYDKKIAWTAQILNEMPSDVWGFQELWHHQSLENCFVSAGLASEYTMLVPIDHAGGKIVCAGAVKTDILVGEPEWIRKFPDNFKLSSGGDDTQTSGISVEVNSFSRPVLHFQVKPRDDGKIIDVFVCHLKSKLPTNVTGEPWFNRRDHSKHSGAIGAAIATIRRTAEATALRMIITEKTKKTDTPVVVLGDFNDAQHSNTLNILTGQPNFLMPGRSGGSDTALYTVGTLQEYRSLRDVYYTHIFKNNMESLDHILVSQEFYDNSRKRLWGFTGMDISNDHLNRDDHKITGTGDHGVVRASFEYRPA